MTEMPGIEALFLPIPAGPARRRTIATDGVNGPVRPSVAEELDLRLYPPRAAFDSAIAP